MSSYACHHCGDNFDRISGATLHCSIACRFIHKIVIDGASGCWEWQGATDHGGYGEFHMSARNARAHRMAYELFAGPIPDGLDLDHLCRNPPCVNPEHL